MVPTFCCRACIVTGVSLTPPPDFRAFVDARWLALVRYAYALTGDRGHAEDVVQVALERTWRRWRHVRAESAEGYVRTVIARLVVSRWRTRRLSEAVLGDREPPPTAGPEESHAVHDVLWRELAALPPRMRAVVVLRFVEDLTEVETARVLDVSVGTVKSQAARALTRLRARSPLLELIGRLPEPDDAEPDDPDPCDPHPCDAAAPDLHDADLHDADLHQPERTGGEPR
jgi:RNA polymerase sigma-70 factor (sigma-E family)